MAKKKGITPIGKRIRRIRLDKKMTLDTIANETGLSKEFIKKIEAGDKRPSVGTLLQISRTLHIDSNFLLKEQGDALEERSKAYTKRTDNYAYTPLTPTAENKHLKAFKIVVGAKKSHDGVGFQHDGEEFTYVLKGKVEVKVGDHINKLKKGDSLHFNSGIKHDLKNTGKTDAELIVVVYAP
ncbi:MAG: helix-turn-helix transcriptional regulator [Desulfobacula sp.]|jgi:transcriptional regulator with XRE-family HTH domain|uniref:helix-turn-helix domain-containing protein n=1 Tax=Desulfobacula sp. TaxID=2593537 RepID=UPI001DFAA219|nr:helix-turn-helix transcriptional regulator [Desulfobacula sp.]MBT3484559.1 helix-turn-helix transcriptional regulator [Desulfobacula sp.]MBT3803929.1 helix-turn-helix transcriptional regulator [Desulfobacula sp.]MBT4023544.1 helix-turn-helix transcriptional regulator [Desulfobacula sp.]MBT4197788.1 helix-turn-helix transcriptional regulator [Desulfobacula sp.]